MSELINKDDNRATIRRTLLTGASVLALTAYIWGGDVAHAEDANHPQLWIELGGQLSMLEDGQETFSPALMSSRPSIFSPSQGYEKPPRHSIDQTGKLSFQPAGSNWVFSAAVRYGRSSSKRHVHQQTYPSPHLKYFYSSYYHTTVRQSAPPVAAKFADTVVQNSEQHTVLDFQAGKDVGLGLFGNAEATSVISAGIRFAQFASRTNIALKSDPDWHFNYKYFAYRQLQITNGQPFHSNLANMNASRSFRGVGPSVSWVASIPVAGNVQDGALMADWGVNAALLFGRQKTRTHHQSTARYHSANGPNFTNTIVLNTVGRYPATPDHTRSRNITVPNVGASIGMTWRLQDFKMSLGYRADFFFGPMDGGIDTRKTYDRNFYGPFAAVSIGFGG